MLLEKISKRVLFLCAVQFQLNQDKMNFSTLRNIQGLHAPLKLQMEYRAARQVTHKLNILVIHLHSSDRPLPFGFSPCLLFVFKSFSSIPSRSSVCRSYRVQTWLWIHCEAMTSASALRTSSTVRTSSLHLYTTIHTTVWMWHPTNTLLSCRSSSEWNDGRATHDGGIQTGTVVKEDGHTQYTSTHVDFGLLFVCIHVFIGSNAEINNWDSGKLSLFLYYFNPVGISNKLHYLPHNVDSFDTLFYP